MATELCHFVYNNKRQPCLCWSQRGLRGSGGRRAGDLGRFIVPRTAGCDSFFFDLL